MRDSQGFSGKRLHTKQKRKTGHLDENSSHTGTMEDCLHGGVHARMFYLSSTKLPFDLAFSMESVSPVLEV